MNDFLVNDLLVRSGEPGRNEDPLARAERVQEAMAGRITLRKALDRAAEKVGERFRGLPLVEAAYCAPPSAIPTMASRPGPSAANQAATALAIYAREKGPEAAETLNAVPGRTRPCRG